MCNSCGCKSSGKSVQYSCACTHAECTCNCVIEFDTEPKSIPYCCAVPMKRIQ